MSGTRPLPPAPILHDLRVTLASDARIDTLLDLVATLAEQVAECRLRVEDALASVSGLRADHQQVQHDIRHIIHMEQAAMVKIADLQDAVTRLEDAQAQHATVTSQAVEMIRTQHVELGEIKAALVTALDNGSDEEIQAVIDRMGQAQSATEAQFATLASAIAEVLPNAPAPEPLPPAEPTPEPTPAPEPVPDVPVEPAPEPLPETPAEPVPDAPSPADPNATNG